MKLLAVFRKTLREQSRDLLMLALSLTFSPFFVVLYWMFFPTGSTTYGVLVLNQDIPLAAAQDSASLDGGAGQAFIKDLDAVRYENGMPLVVAKPVASLDKGKALLRDRQAAALLVIPPEFSRALQGQAPLTTTVTFIGDLTNPAYPIAASLASSTLDQFVRSAMGQPSPLMVIEQPLGGSGYRTEFEVYVPGLLVFAVILLVFMAAMTVTREVEAGTLRRLKITRMGSFDLLGGITLSLVLLAAAQMLLAYVTALALGFRSQGPLWLAAVIGVLTGLSVIGVGLLVAGFARSVNQAFLIANFPLGLMMFFSGSIFPMPRAVLFSLAGRGIGPYDLLPATHAVAALNKVLTLGAGPKEVAFELAALTCLSAAYFLAGVWFFQRRQMKA